MKQFQFLCGKHEGLTERILYKYHTSCKDLEVILYKSFTQSQQSMLIKVQKECIYAGTLHALACTASLSSAEVQMFVVKKSAVQCVCRCIVKWINQTENLWQMSFSRTPTDFTALAKFDSLKLTENHC